MLGKFQERTVINFEFKIPELKTPTGDIGAGNLAKPDE
jgi:hypothetical protein